MTVLHQYDYLFAITTCFAFLDAWNIGANDVANSFATSVSSRCLTMKQAMLIASVMEFSGSVLVGSRVAETIRTKIVDPVLYEKQPSILLLAMMCAIIGSSVFLTAATRWGLPVSTTHSIVGGVVGAATASVGINNVSWGWDGVAQVFAAWVIAPGISGMLGALVFSLTNHFVLKRKGGQPIRRALLSVPFYTFVTVAALAMLVIWKGIQLDIEPTATQILISIFTVAAGATLLQSWFVLPYLWRKVVREDWPLKWYMIWRGPFLLKRSPPPSPPPGISRVNITNYYRGHLTLDELATVRASESLLSSVQSARSPADLEKDTSLILPPPALSPTPPRSRGSPLVPPRPPGPWYTPRVLLHLINRVLLRGLEKDIISLQKHHPTSVLSWDLADMHSHSKRYDNRVEYMYSSLQIITASAASFIHGANDVANCIGPFATAYSIWRTGEINTSEEGNEVPVWALCFGGAAIVLGLLTYGYHVMRTLGNRLTLISPSRGFCMELASAVTVLVSTRLKLPVSTTQCITGATVGVGLANGDWRCVNWRLIGWIYLGWVVTVPVAGVIAGGLMAVIINAPRWG